METRLRDCLEKDEMLLWQRLPGSGAQKRSIVCILVLGHVFLTAAALFFGVSVVLLLPVDMGLRIALLVLLCAAMNAPLVAWTLYKLPSLQRSGDSVYFLTERRVGLLRQSGELRQIPLQRGIRVMVFPNGVTFKMGEHHQVTFAGLTAEEISLVQALLLAVLKRIEKESQAEPS